MTEKNKNGKKLKHLTLQLETVKSMLFQSQQRLLVNPDCITTKLELQTSQDILDRLQEQILLQSENYS